MLQLKVEAIKRELEDTATFFLSEVSFKSIYYKAGQFVTLVFNHHSEEIRRSYSLSSSPDERLLSITVKRIANGEISRFLLTKIKKGDILNAVEPAGMFTINNFEEEKDIFLFAAGSGITPIFSQLKYILNRPGKSSFTLVYSNQNKNTVLFDAGLNNLSNKNPGRLKIIHLLSSENNRLNNLLVEQLVTKNLKKPLGHAEFYTCGPFTYMRMIRLTLLFMGIDPDKIRKENFVAETVAVNTENLNFSPKKISIHFRTETYSIVTGENQSILDAALQNKIPLPYSCRAGECSTCSAICKSGNVEIIKNNILTGTDLSAGWILTCTGCALTDDVVIEF